MLGGFCAVTGALLRSSRPLSARTGWQSHLPPRLPKHQLPTRPCHMKGQLPVVLKCLSAGLSAKTCM